MKKWFSVLVVLLSVVVLSIATVAWIAPNNRANGIDGHTDGIMFEYNLDGIGSFVEEFDVTNLTFFDINGHYDDQDEALFELDYFLEEATEVKLTFTNTCKYDIHLNVRQQNLDASVAHVLCIFSKTQITDVSTYNSIEELINSCDEVSLDINTQNLNGTFNSEVIYMYIIGVQPDDSASDKFLDSTYGLELYMKATGVD